MLPLAHLGIGSLMARPISRRLPLRWLLLGTLLPDLIDKPIYFAFRLLEHFQSGGEVPGRRGIAHTGVFLLLILGLAAWKKSARFAAVGVGIATHMVLDVVSKLGLSHSVGGCWTVIFWPVFGWAFPTLPYGMPMGVLMALEAVGALLLAVQIVNGRFRPAVF